MAPRRPRRSPVSAARLALVGIACLAFGACSASPTVPSPAVSSPPSVAPARAAPTPRASAAPASSATPAPTTAIDGKWGVRFSRDEMLAVGVADKAEDDGSNFGAFILTLEGGRYGLEQLDHPYSRGGGTFEVHGSSFVYTADNGDGPFACAFVLTSDTLSFPTVHDADGKLGQANCTMPFRVKPWNRIGGPAGSTPSGAASPSLAVLPTGRVAEGAYTTLFQPGLRLTLDRPAENDADTPTSWIDLVFERDPNYALQIVRLDKVIDPKHPNRVIDPPADLAAWIAKLPGLTAVAPARSVRVGGLDATQLDLRTGSRGILIAPIPGIDYSSGYSGMPAVGHIESGKAFRLIVVPVQAPRSSSAALRTAWMMGPISGPSRRPTSRSSTRSCGSEIIGPMPDPAPSRSSPALSFWRPADADLTSTTKPSAAAVPANGRGADAIAVRPAFESAPCPDDVSREVVYADLVRIPDHAAGPLEALRADGPLFVVRIDPPGRHDDARPDGDGRRRQLRLPAGLRRPRRPDASGRVRHRSAREQPTRSRTSTARRSSPSARRSSGFGSATRPMPPRSVMPSGPATIASRARASTSPPSTSPPARPTWKTCGSRSGSSAGTRSPTGPARARRSRWRVTSRPVSARSSSIRRPCRRLTS